MNWFKSRTGGEIVQLMPPRWRPDWAAVAIVLFKPLTWVFDQSEVYKDDVRMRLQTLASTGVLEHHLRRITGASASELRIADILADEAVDFEIRIKPLYNTPEKMALIRSWLDRHKLLGKTYRITVTDYVLTPPDYSRADYSADYNRT